MAKAGGLRPRALAGIFGGYFLLAFVLAYILAGIIAPYDAPGYIRWILAAFVLLGALVLVGVCTGALRRARALDDRLDALEWEEQEALEYARQAAAEPHTDPLTTASAAETEPTDADVDQLLMDLHRLGTEEAVEPEPAAESAPVPALKTTAELRFAADDLNRLRKVRGSLASLAAGPAIASAFLVGVFASLLPASDGMLSDVWLNTFVGLAGLLGLLGVAVYAGATFRMPRSDAASPR